MPLSIILQEGKQGSHECVRLAGCSIMDYNRLGLVCLEFVDGGVDLSLFCKAHHTTWPPFRRKQAGKCAGKMRKHRRQKERSG